MKIVFATNNRHKLQEVSAILGPDVELITPADLGITEDIPETQETLEGNALQKARYVYERILRGTDCCPEGSVASAAAGEDDFRIAEYAVGIPTFADDTGLEVAALGGAPGVRSARYAADAGEGSLPSGEGTFDDNNRLLLRRMKDATDRSAGFRTVVALILGGREYLFEGKVDGHIIEEYRGTGGFGYDPVFVPEDSSVTFAEMSAEQKNSISHRARAVEKLNEFLKTR